MALLFALATAALYAGWRLHWFLTDDAYIAFRFVSNRQLGFGYTWNAPPFVPVEGYTSFAWVVILDTVWSWFGVEPPVAANPIAFVMALGSLGVMVWATWRLCQVHGAECNLPGLVAAVLIATISQRSFLIWASSGLETALFNLLLQGWILVGLLARISDAASARRFGLWLCALASAVALTRPDGLLLVAASVAVLAALALTRTLRARDLPLAAAPLLAVALHLGWRLATYGDLLPNTYYAKVVRAWPAAGLRYGAAFTLEYAYWLAAPGWLWVLYRWLRALHSSSKPRALVHALVLVTVCAKLGFDLLIAGGDHFEYRSLSWTVPLAALALVHTGLTRTRRAGLVAPAIIAFAAMSAVLPWTQYALTREHTEWPARPAVIPLAPSAPLPFRPIALGLDALEAWLLPRGVGIRQYEHKAFWQHQLNEFPTREEGTRRCEAELNPVSAQATIGVAGWTLSRCHILDLRGLTDRVIARAPLSGSGPEYLGHDRRPPREYVLAFKPNVFVHAGKLAVLPRPSPLTDRDIEQTEHQFAP